MIRRPPRSTLFPYTPPSDLAGHHLLRQGRRGVVALPERDHEELGDVPAEALHALQDRKSTRLNSSHANISYAVFCLKKKNWRIAGPSGAPWAGVLRWVDPHI